MTKENSHMTMLDSITFGIAYHAGLGPAATVTIELDRQQAEAFLFKLSKELDSLMVDFQRSHSIIGLGTVFQYRGTNFRVVERAKYT